MIFGVSHLLLEGFRNYRRLELNVSPGFTLVAGPNAQGKTNLLEAIYLLASTQMLRGRRDAEAIQEGEIAFRVEAILGSGSVIAASLRGEGENGSRSTVPRFRGRRTSWGVCRAYASQRSICGWYGGNLRTGGVFLDLELSALYASYLRDLASYKRALEQRNALLKMAQEGSIPEEAFAPWEETMAARGAAMRRRREEYIATLEPEATALHARLGSGEKLSLSLEPKDEAKTEGELRGLAVRRREEILRGTTLSGPHRDDVRIDVGGRDARLFGSQGQQRSAVIALKMGTLLGAKEVLGATPLLLLDDILSDLDATRRERLVEIVLENADQAILTCTEPEAAGPEILTRATVLRVHHGHVAAA